VHERASLAGKRVQALGGAKNHAVVLPDADVGFAARQIAAAAFGSAGQRCMAISAVVAVGGVGDAVVAALRAQAETVKVGPGADPASEMGPLVTREARERIAAAVTRGVEAGARLLVDGRELVVDGHEEGFFLGPCLLDEVTPAMEVHREEIFGPVVVVLRVATLEDAIELVNGSPYGNGAAIFTAGGRAAREFTRRVHSGMVGVNVPIPVPMAYHSFGGWKDSLFGDTHVHGPEGVAFYTRAKTVTSRWPWQAAGEQPEPAPLHFPTAN